MLATTASAAEPYRFLDHSVVPVVDLEIDGLLKRVLNPYRSQEVFAVPALRDPVLSFSIGQKGVDGSGTIRFKVEIKRAEGDWTSIYEKDLSKPGWVDERVPLSGDLSGAQLRFGRRMISGTREAAAKSAWGDPVLLPAQRSQRPSVILISLDTLRADRLGLYGYKKARTPVLDAFGKSGVWYSDAYSPSAWTLPSHASLFYGRLLSGVPERSRGKTPAMTPEPEVPSLAVALRAAGYLTAGFTGGGYVSANFAFDRGFDTYFSFQTAKKEPGTCPPERFDGAEVFKRATAWVRDRGSAPFFLFLHTYDVHDRCPFQKTTQGHDDQAWDNLSPERHTELLSYYDELIAGLDTRVGEFLRELDTLGLQQNTLIVITSDHGELFNEHGQRGHGCTNTMYEGLVRVPLMIRHPARLEPRATVRTPVSIVDVAPTILSWLGMARPSAMTGMPLPGLGSPGDEQRPVVMTCDTQVAVRNDRYKLLSFGDGKRKVLYDLETDNSESRDISASNATITDSLQSLVSRHTEAAIPTSAHEHKELDEETKERLRALGYAE